MMDIINYDSDFEDEFGTPPEITEAAKAAVLNLLPVKSREKYISEYQRFKDWSTKEKAKKVSENVLLAYFASLVKVYKASSLWSKYSMIKAVLIVRENIDISRFAKLIAFLKRNSDGYKAKKSKVFSKEEVNKFMVEASDRYYLMMKVFAIMGIAGACRRQELITMTLDDIQDIESTIVVKVPVTKTDTKQNCQKNL